MGEEVEEFWADNDNVAIIDFLDDIGQPYSCSQWGSFENPELPIIINDGASYNFHDQFSNIYATNVFIDHEMKVNAISSPSSSSLDTTYTAGYFNDKIQEMLDATIFGCTESDACNYNSDAITDDGSCLENDCAGECGGSVVVDCTGECGGSSVEDLCGECGGGETNANNCLGIYNDFIVVNQFQIQRFYPNPFNPVLNININLAWAGMTQVNILDIAGAHIETLHSGFLKSGSHELSWHAESMPSGVYFISLNSGDKSLIEKVVLLK
ncbi:T9SS C-terminal target domain-containing protein [Candidatus Marinimicrobia bacterium PRS2]|nr:T9SS C-terminal target domain-containing protein [Candidatus Marinimicrobia bacterium PRS2]